jgi:hypothetical protein
VIIVYYRQFHPSIDWKIPIITPRWILLQNRPGFLKKAVSASPGPVPTWPAGSLLIIVETIQTIVQGTADHLGILTSDCLQQPEQLWDCVF